MRGYLATGILSQPVADVLKEKARQENTTTFNSLIEFIEQSDKWWKVVGSPYSKPVLSDADPRLDELRSSFDWFDDWYNQIKSLPLGQFSAKGKEKMFVAKKTFWALEQTTMAFIGLCKHYLPDAPEGCGIRAWRCSQDPLEAYFVSLNLAMLRSVTTPTLPKHDLKPLCMRVCQNYVRSCNGATSHPTMRECLTAASGRYTNTVLSKSANNGERGRKKKRDFDKTSQDLPGRARGA